MNLRYVRNWCWLALLAALAASFGLQGSLAAPPGPPGADPGVEVLTRGPVHEAFAETVTFDPEPGIVVPKTPPAAIEELPPDQKPEGANVAWVPGYWAWDDERTDYLWVSGIWRDLPPGRQWMPGYWSQSTQGFQWTSGYWADSQVVNVEYLPEPPATVEAGPNIAASSPDTTWLPGGWVWQDSRYAWRPGYWAAVQPDWDWVPSHYVYAPRGYVHVGGYWDYSIGRRGVLFAPVYFNAGVYSQPGFSYSPSTVINPAVFADSLFLRPQYQHYYFGDYYDANYQTAGFYPSYSYNSGRYGYDPIYAHERWQHRQDSRWEQRVAADFQNRRAHVDARPARTWTAQNARGIGAGPSREPGIVMAAPLSSLITSKTSPLRFRPVNPVERKSLVQRGQEVQRFREERQKLETRVAGPAIDRSPKGLAPTKVPLSRSPLVARPMTELGKDHVPPQMHVAPPPDLRVEAKARAARLPEQPQQRTVNRLPLDTPQTQPQPKVPQPQPRVERPAAQPQPQPKVERPAPPPKVERPAPQPAAGPAAAGPNPDKRK